MSRWSRKTTEEKEQILQSIEQQKTIKENKIERMNYISTDWRLKLLKEGEIPFYCSKHGWTKSDKYILENRIDMFGKTLYILGKCPKCNSHLETFIAKDPMYMMWVSLGLAKLKGQGRIIDKRKRS